MNPKPKYYETVSKTIIKNLNKRQIEGYYCTNSKKALVKALELMPKGSSISWGGSETIIETGLLNSIQKNNYKIINRDSATTPENVLILTGINKIVTDIESGIKRTRNIASPPNAIRLDRNTPCAITGKCGDCFSKECMCCQIVITRFSLIPNRIKVILIGEELGY